MIPMRDGVRLSTDLYFPEGTPGKLPVVLIRSPYNKKRYELASEVLVNKGYLEDGYDTIEWLAGQPWSNGKVGT